ncbi:HK97 gp10 family phage protein [Streptomyces platensis]|uniref:HK97-gp10 family putative phage morphogenesis protein n=1 Tax=Streptomyces platensis TaxID=58346 RepID=UPI002ED28AC1|nr:HK97 gp10 family phage protein [Streptomyces platensis]
MAGNLRGLRRAVARLKALPIQMNRARNRALEEWASDLEKTAKELAPVRSGRLRDSIGSRVNKTSGKAWVQVNGQAREYAYYVEKGTSKMADQPFMGPAAQLHRRTGERAIRDATPRYLGRG